MVWEEEGPTPILYISLMDFMTVSSNISIFPTIIAESAKKHNGEKRQNTKPKGNIPCDER
jgi:hypothetical protein